MAKINLEREDFRKKSKRKSSIFSMEVEDMRALRNKSITSDSTICYSSRQSITGEPRRARPTYENSFQLGIVSHRCPSGQSRYTLWDE